MIRLSQIFDPAPGLERWKRFQSHYSRRIKVLNFKGSLEHNDLSALLIAIQRTRPSLAILPNLRELNWIGSDHGRFEDMIMFICENLKDLSCSGEEDDLDPSFLPLLCETIQVLAPGLTNLILDIYPSSVYVSPLADHLKSLVNLTHLTIPAFPNISPILSTLDSFLSSLRSLSFNAFATNMAVTDTGGSLCNFPALYNLEFSTKTYQTVGQFLRASQLGALTSLTLDTISLERPASIRTLLLDISQRYPFLEELELKFKECELKEHPDIQNSPLDTSPIIAFNDFAPILNCKRISLFMLDHPHALNISDPDLERVALAWKGLKSLNLSNTPLNKNHHDITKPTLWSILFLANQCPDLEELTILVDTRPASMLPPNQIPSPGSSHTARKKVAALMSLDVGHSLIESDDVNRVASLLSQVCSPRCELTWDDDTDELPWHKVEDLLPYFSRMQSTIRVQSERIGFLEHRLGMKG
ncbi:hypothetical protein VKT23_016308 [Stygiomarasmius scandens]|uniref:Uncharacterized protein n=1 Tax=Marasmiellus scandens TaxID=2682957 RepID=A0ABR1IVE3_9AGAR